MLGKMCTYSWMGLGQSCGAAAAPGAGASADADHEPRHRSLLAQLQPCQA